MISHILQDFSTGNIVEEIAERFHSVLELLLVLHQRMLYKYQKNQCTAVDIVYVNIKMTKLTLNIS